MGLWPLKIVRVAHKCFRKTWFVSIKNIWFNGLQLYIDKLCHAGVSHRHTYAHESVTGNLYKAKT